jgi:hypothetical protein
MDGQRKEITSFSELTFSCVIVTQLFLKQSSQTPSSCIKHKVAAFDWIVYGIIKK